MLWSQEHTSHIIWKQKDRHLPARRLSSIREKDFSYSKSNVIDMSLTYDRSFVSTLQPTTESNDAYQRHLDFPTEVPLHPSASQDYLGKIHHGDMH